jgi:Uma2 family endonuclease
MVTSTSIRDWLHLKEGMLLSRNEFDQLGEHRGLERLEGRLYLPPAAVRFIDHGEPQAILDTWGMTYRLRTPGVYCGASSTIRLGPDHDPEPDLVLFRDARCGGNVTIDDKGYLHGPPELVVEISASTQAKDLQTKRRIYAEAGIPEYIVWDVQASQLYWFDLVGHEYVRRVAPVDGIVHSQSFPGLWLDSNCLIAGDYAGVLATLNNGLDSPEHAAFVQKLAKAER